MKSFEWTNATSIPEALGQLDGRAMVKAGGVDLIDLMKERIVSPARVVNLRTVPGLDGLSFDPKSGLSLGPMVTLARIEADPAVLKHYPALAEAAAHTATPQVRNMATLGGNLVQRPRCWYFRSEHFQCRKKGGETCFALEGENQYHAVFGNQQCAIVHPSTPATALVALGAELELTGPKGKRELRLEQFFAPPSRDVRRENVLGGDELITSIRVPAPAAGTRSAFHKQGEKESFDWPLSDVAVVLQLEGGVCRKASVVLGAAAPVPLRSTAAEAVLVGKRIDEAVARQAGEAAIQGATPLSQNAYKLAIIQTVVRRVVLAAAGGGA